MLFRISRQCAGKVALPLVFLFIAAAEAHVVPNMSVEADFAENRTFTLRINVDPRTFLAADPTTLPPVPGSWYRDQTQEQIDATHGKAQEYLSRALSVLVDGHKINLPACEIQAIDGTDNTPLARETQEVHLLAIIKGEIPAKAGTFQIEFAKDANTSLILLHSQVGRGEQRPQVLFPGEVSRTFQIKAAEPAKVVPQPPPEAKSSQIFPAITLLVVSCLGIYGWRLLKRHRHYHHAHRKPGSSAPL